MVSLASTDPMGWPSASDESDEALGLAQTSPSTASGERCTLDRILQVGGPMGELRATRIALQIAEALAAVHAAGTTHGALAPANVLVTTSRGQDLVTLADIEREAFDATRGRAGNAGGRLRYTSPEQWHGGAVGPWSDVYAVGVILYELLTGRSPVLGRSMVELARNVLHAPIVPMRALRPALSPVLDAIVIRCLDKDPTARWSTAHGLAAALRPSVAPAPSRRAGRGWWRAAAVGPGGVAIAAAPGGV